MFNKEVVNQEIIFNKIYSVSSWCLVAMSIWIIYSGLETAIATTGYVRGSEFGMQITIANLLAKMLAWVGLYFIWYWSGKKVLK